MAKRVKNPFPDELKEPVLDILRAYGWVEDAKLLAEIFGVTNTQMASFLRSKAALAAVLDGRTLEQTKQMRDAVRRARPSESPFPPARTSSADYNGDWGCEGENLIYPVRPVPPEVLAALNAYKERSDDLRHQCRSQIQGLIREFTEIHKDCQAPGSTDGSSQGNPS